MSKITVALGSFIVGACFMLLVGSHTSTLAQVPGRPTPPPTPAPLAPRPCAMEGFSFTGNKHAVAVEGTEPTASVVFGPRLCHGSITKGAQALDGLDCDGCKFEDVTLEYSGGAYNLQNAQFSGVIRVVLKGPAANTMAILPLLQAIAVGHSEPPPNPNRPILKSATAKELLRIDWRSPYSGQ